MTLLEIRNITKSFGGFAAIDDLSFSVSSGELRCLLGPNGAGKSTCMDLIVGQQRVDRGSILYNGEDITAMSEVKISRKGIGRKFQIPAVFKNMTVRENLDVAFNRRMNPFRNMCSFGTHRQREEFAEVVEIIGLQNRLGTIAGILSHGEMQWLEIGLLLMRKPTLLLMDEPVAGMTEQEVYRTADIFNSLKGRHTLIVVEHDMSFVKKVADMITVMHMGKVLAHGRVSDIERNAEVRSVYLGEQGMQ